MLLITGAKDCKKWMIYTVSAALKSDRMQKKMQYSDTNAECQWIRPQEASANNDAWAISQKMYICHYSIAIIS